MDWSLVLTVTFAGIFIVFAALILLSIFVFLYPKILEKFKNKPILIRQVELDNKNIIEPNIVSDLDTIENDDEIIAVITAAIASINKSSYSSNIYVKNIRRNDTRASIWNSTGRLEQLN